METISAIITLIRNGFRSYPTDDELMSLEGGGALEDQLPGRLLLVEGDEAEILGGVVAQLVYGADHLNHCSKLKNHSQELFDHTSITE